MIAEDQLQIWIPWWQPPSTTLRALLEPLILFFGTHEGRKRSMMTLSIVLVVKPGVMRTHWAASKDNCNYSSSGSTFSWNGPKSYIISYCICHIISHCSSVGKQFNIEQGRWWWGFPSFSLQTQSQGKDLFLNLHIKPIFLQDWKLSIEIIKRLNILLQKIRLEKEKFGRFLDCSR